MAFTNVVIHGVAQHPARRNGPHFRLQQLLVPGLHLRLPVPAPTSHSHHPLDVYSGLFGDDLEAVAERLDAAATARNVVRMWSQDQEGAMAMPLDPPEDHKTPGEGPGVVEPPIGVEPMTYALREPSMRPPDLHLCSRSASDLGKCTRSSRVVFRRPATSCAPAVPST